MRLWDVGTGTEKVVLTGHTDWISSVAFSSDGQTLATGSGDNTVRLWDVGTGTEKSVLIGHTDWVYSVVFSPDGQMIATGSRDNTVRLWDVGTSTEKSVLIGHTDWVYSVAFSPDGQMIATGSQDGTVLLWRVSPPASTPRLTTDVNNDGQVNIQDLVTVAAHLGETDPTDADVNNDGKIDILDLVAVAAAFGENVGNAPSAINLSSEMLQRWLTAAAELRLTDPVSRRGIRVLEGLLRTLTPKTTALLPNYPNPFNPETWIPYQLAAPAEVIVEIYSAGGALVRRLAVGHKVSGIYEGRERAVYWDGKNELGESVSSGVYFYTLRAGDFTATRKMVIRK